MNKKHKNDIRIGRRKFLPFLGTGLLISLLPSSARSASQTKEKKEQYQTLLKPDGTVVRVKSSKVTTAKKIRQKVNNSDLLNWLDNQEGHH